MARRSRVFVVGSSNTDLVVRTSSLPKPGETVIGKAMETYAGGKGANQAVAAARAGARVSFVGAFGDDEFGRARRKDLEREGIDCSGCVVKKGVASGVAVISVDAKGENQILVAPGANALLTPTDVKRGLRGLREGDVVLCSLEVPIPSVRKALDLAWDIMAHRVLNPAPFPSEGWPNDWRFCADYMTPNDQEFTQLLGATTCSTKAERLLSSQMPIGATKDRYAHSIVVTRGAGDVISYFGTDRCYMNWIEGKKEPARGDDWCLGKVRYRVPKVKAIDTVGAGDCFNGAFAANLSLRSMKRDPIRFAIAAASIQVTRRGAQSAMPQRAEILKVLRRMERDDPMPAF